MLGVGDGVHLVGGALQPQHWVFHFVEACLEAIPVAEIDRARPESAPALVSGVVGAVGFQPEVPFFVGDILAEAGAPRTAITKSSSTTQSSLTGADSASMDGLQNSDPFQHPLSMLAWLSKSMEVPKITIPWIVSGASRAGLYFQRCNSYLGGTR